MGSSQNERVGYRKCNDAKGMQALLTLTIMPLAKDKNKKLKN